MACQVWIISTNRIPTPRSRKICLPQPQTANGLSLSSELDLLRRAITDVSFTRTTLRNFLTLLQPYSHVSSSAECLYTAECLATPATSGTMRVLFPSSHGTLWAPCRLCVPETVLSVVPNRRTQSSGGIPSKNSQLPAVSAIAEQLAGHWRGVGLNMGFM